MMNDELKKEIETFCFEKNSDDMYSFFENKSILVEIFYLSVLVKPKDSIFDSNFIIYFVGEYTKNRWGDKVYICYEPYHKTWSRVLDI